MKVDLKAELLDLEGKPMAAEEGSSENMTVGQVLLIVLNTPLKEDLEEGGEKRYKKFELAQNIYKNKKGSLEIDSGDLQMLKDRVLKIFPSPLTYGRICEAFGDKT